MSHEAVSPLKEGVSKTESFVDLSFVHKTSWKNFRPIGADMRVPDFRKFLTEDPKKNFQESFISGCKIFSSSWCTTQFLINDISTSDLTKFIQFCIHSLFEIDSLLFLTQVPSLVWDWFPGVSDSISKLGLKLIPWWFWPKVQLNFKLIPWCFWPKF